MHSCALIVATFAHTYTHTCADTSQPKLFPGRCSNHKVEIASLSVLGDTFQVSATHLRTDMRIQQYAHVSKWTTVGQVFTNK